MSKIKLDKSRPHSTVHGDAEYGLAAYQDGLPFNHQGELIEKLVTPEMQPIVDKKLRKLAKLEAANAPKDSVQQDPPIPEPEDDEDEDENDGDSADEINFEQWLKDETKYPWHLLAKEGKKRYSKVFSNSKELADFLVYEEQILGPEDVPTKLGKKD